MIEVKQVLSRQNLGEVKITTMFINEMTGRYKQETQYFTDDVNGDGENCSPEYEEQLKFFCVTEFAKNL